MKKYYQGKPLKQNKAVIKKKNFEKWIEFLALKKGFFEEKTPNVGKCLTMS